MLGPGGCSQKGISLGCFPPVKMNRFLFWSQLIGFFFNVSVKFNSVARVYLPKLLDTQEKWKKFCPLRALRMLSAHDLLTQNPFSGNKPKKPDLIDAMRIIDRNKIIFKSHSLRIGANTFFLTYGLPEAYVEFLSCRKTPKITAIY